MGDAKDKMKAIHYQDFVNKLDDIFQTYEQKTAIVEYVTEENVRKYSYGELFEYAMKVKLALARLNVLPKERAAVWHGRLPKARCFSLRFPILDIRQC